MKNIFSLVIAMICLITNAQHEHHRNSQNGETLDRSKMEHNHNLNLEAPISVMGSHMHEKGSWMSSYRFMNMTMNGLREGTNDISNTEGHETGYMVTPLEMGMSMHMVGIMFALSQKLTLMSMFNIVENDMNMQMINMAGMIMPFSTSSSGFGDVKISGLYNFLNKKDRTLHGQLGVSLPVGSIDETVTTPMSNGNKVVLPYSMQIGSGTFDSDFGLTYVRTTEKISWGHQIKGTFRFGENSNDYTLGNECNLDNWLVLKVVNWLSVSGRLEGVIVEGISGANPDLNPMMVSTADTANYGGTYINSGIGLNTYVIKGAFKDLQLGAEYELLLHQDLNGIQ
jgi:hypothetical protein